ncbi:MULTISPECIES: DNA polymerase III subunit alpha [unclassified Facklamia]|uniref:DNA polymerase III subunit alpha n=1 Tax=Aerococcaceae TaxID=186827 RepID=UPI0013B5E1F9|nr:MULTISPECIES: DNA polymerase III subunit alpha [unclassified Facklamia]NEW63724.1 DNA polymerase III subunit alpha [Facklamia sp. 252]NEW67195.1 DNA polymerase III subunit alpha [Facklamia sp. 253]QQD66265.1 DNA polymerase III subunit alpha [Aerococcaceae bacterium zg-252]
MTLLLNVHTAYSLLKSTLTIDAYVQRAKEYGYRAIGIADINVLHGAVEFYQKCQQQNVQPLLGMTLQVNGFIRQDKQYSLLLFAKNYSGFQQLMYLSSELTKEQRSDATLWDYIEQEPNDLVVISAGKESELEQALFHSQYDIAEQILKRWQQYFGTENVYLGVQAFPYQPKEIELIQQFALKHQVPLVMNQLVNTLERHDAFTLKVLGAIERNDTLELSLRQMEGTTYLYPYQELVSMYELTNIPNLIANTDNLIQSLQFELPLSQAFLPKFHVPNGLSSVEYLFQLVNQSMVEKGLVDKDEYQQRLKYELDIINQMGFNDYFLIVWEMMRFCHETGIRTGPGRGSAAGSLVSYLLDITLVDPIQYQLLFERFLNPERYSMPDIDVDIPDNKRELVLKHMEQYYSHEQVAQIGTFGTFGAKQALRDTLRVLNYSTDEMSQWSKAVPRELNINLKRAYEMSQTLRTIVNRNERNSHVFQIAQTIEGLPRHMSTHAAGIVIHDKPLTSVIPVIERENQLLLTQYTMYDVEKVGLLKLDILGLRNLSILDDILNNIKKLTGETLDIYQIPMNDQETLGLFRSGDTSGVFQFESEGIRNVLRKLQPSNFEEIVAVNALYRPGPMKQIDEFIKRKNKQVTVAYLHPLLEPILKHTYGIIVYQEQVMQICQQLAGYTLGQADLLRRAMAKKQADVMKQERDHFIQGAFVNGIEVEIASKVYDYIDAFASYGFNRSHAVVYSTLAYQLAYLKVHYPLAFYQAILNQGQSNTTSHASYVEEARRRLGKVVGVNINRSQATLSVDDAFLRLGLDSVKGIRKEFIAHVLNDRQLLGEYQTFINFLGRLPKKFLKQDLIESLIKVGAFDDMGYNRATLSYNLPKFIKSIEFSGLNVNLFEEVEPKVEWQKEWNVHQMAIHEQEVLGFSLLPHPLEQYGEQLKQMDSLADIAMMRVKQRIKTIIYIDSIRFVQTKKDETMAFVTADTSQSKVTLVVFPNVLIKSQRWLQPHQIVQIDGVIDRNQRGELQVIVNHFSDVNQQSSNSAAKANFTKCFIKLTAQVNPKLALQFIEELASQSPGPCHVILVNDQKETWQLSNQYQLGYGYQTQHALKDYFGEKNVVYR